MLHDAKRPTRGGHAPGEGTCIITTCGTKIAQRSPRDNWAWVSGNAHDLTAALGGTWHGRYGTAPCPVCQPAKRRDQNALTIADGRDGRLLAHCKRAGCSFTDILAAAGLGRGDYRPPDPAEAARREAERQAEAEKRARQAERIWKEAQPIAGTIAETYLRRARGINIPLPKTLGYHPAAWHGPTARRLPAMLALVEGGDGFAVHRTYLRPDGSGKAALAPDRMMLGATRGGAVRLADGPGPPVVAEGIETALSLPALLPETGPIWAALSTSGLRGLRLPPQPGELIVAGDGDDAGREAAHTLAEQAHALGWDVSLLPAPEGRDWNDMLRKKGVR